MLIRLQTLCGGEGGGVRVLGGWGGGVGGHYRAPSSLMYPRRRINKYTKYVQNICSLQCFCLIQENFRHRVIEVRLGGGGGSEEMIVRLRHQFRRNAEDQGFFSSVALESTSGLHKRASYVFAAFYLAEWQEKYSKFACLLQRYSPYLMLDLISVLRGGPWGSLGPSGWGGTPDAWTADLSSPRTPSLPPSYADTLPSGSGSSLEDSTNNAGFSLGFF